MTITTAFRFALTAAALCAATPTADARPRRVVVSDFDGPRQLADAGRNSVLSALGDQYDIIATKRWDDARNAAAQKTHGPAQWARAAKQSGVDAVIEGWILDEGRRKILNIVVREADNGREFDTISVRLDGKTGVSTESARQLQTSLEAVLEWIDLGRDEVPPPLPPIDIKKLGPKSATDDVRVHRRAPIDGDADPPAGASRRRPAGEAEVATDDQPRSASPASKSTSGRTDKAAGDRSDAPERPERTERSDAEPAAPAEPAHDARPATVSAADEDAHTLEILFPQRSEERAEVLGPKADHVPQKTPRFMIDGGGFVTSRSLIWDAPPDANVQQFAGVSSKGFQVNAAIYPFPTKAIDGVLSGFGFTGSLHHSVGSTVVSDEDDQTAEYVINQNGWELGVHYRAPLSSLVTIDGGAFYGNQTYEIVDASMAFETPDTKYSYLGASGHLDLAITDRATIGVGARYFTVLDAGDLASTNFFGPVSASGLGLEASFQVPLPANLYVRGQLSYQRISLETTGGGQITDDEGVIGGTDSLITGNVNIGIAF